MHIKIVSPTQVAMVIVFVIKLMSPVLQNIMRKPREEYIIVLDGTCLGIWGVRSLSKQHRGNIEETQL